ncbi:MAG: L,D-transpeptidase family protein [Campylobacterales bacterium]|nr:L,D-transpeptidase family protein [Campylobacterales bacterium]
MSKKISLFFIFLLIPPLWGSQQLIVVISPELNSTSGILQRYENEGYWYKVGEVIPVILGRRGLGYSSLRQPQKNEGDGRSPAGVFDIGSTFGYTRETNSSMPYFHADETLICVDDINDPFYNKMTLLNPSNPPKSFETMRRNDDLYRYGAVIEYNRRAEKGRGSCIFFHLNRPTYTPTSGCTAMDEKPLLELLQWLDPDKNPRLLQIPASDCREYQKEFEGIECK